MNDNPSARRLVTVLTASYSGIGTELSKRPAALPRLARDTAVQQQLLAILREMAES
ncbi:hypothetical protein AB4Z29_25980 [Paenibacillus sp. 2TAB23]|uniref:hypothetical protein n=1 Tax=Paenibacillus sp. 2TAB23 TaxID=3233004 RepID=UPI003F968144